MSSKYRKPGLLGCARLLNDKDGAGSPAHNFLGNAAHEKVLEPTPAMRADNNQIATVFPGYRFHRLCRIALGKEILCVDAGGRRDQALESFQQVLDVGFRLYAGCCLGIAEHLDTQAVGNVKNQKTGSVLPSKFACDADDVLAMLAEVSRNENGMWLKHGMVLVK